MKWHELWAEGKYADFWSLNHVLSGVLLATLFFVLKFNFLWTFIFCFVLFVGYEVFEEFVNIDEAFTNRVADVFFDLVGFFITAYFYVIKETPFSIFVIFVLVFCLIGLQLWGFAAYVKRTRLGLGKKRIENKKFLFSIRFLPSP